MVEELQKDINWYIEEPERFLLKKPFVRGGKGIYYYDSSNSCCANELKPVKGSKIKYKEISQDVYLSELDPNLHAVTDMSNMPKITVRFKNGKEYCPQDIILTSGYQKTLHSTQIQHLSHSEMKFSLLGENPIYASKDSFLDKFLSAIKIGNQSDVSSEENNELFSQFQQLWKYENEESRKADIYSTQKGCGDVGVLFQGNEKDPKNIRRKIMRYKDNYITIPNYNEYGDEIATTFYYTTDDGNVERMDVYTDDMVYRFAKVKNIDGIKDYVPIWEMIDGHPRRHGYSSNPLLYKRGVVAWEYVHSYITVKEMIENVIALCQKYYSTFMMAIYGNVEEGMLDNLIGDIVSINIANPTGKERVDVISFPENMSAYKYLEYLDEQIQKFSFTTIGSNKNTQTNGSDSRGGAMTMRFKADIALAKQTQMDFADFWSSYVRLLQEAFDMKYYDNKVVFRKLLIKPEQQVWTPISDSLLIDNIAIAYEKGFLSMRTAIEKCPLSERDELLRKLSEDEKAFENELEKLKSQTLQTNNVQSQEEGSQNTEE